MIRTVSNNHVTSIIESESDGVVEFASACTMDPNSPQKRAVAISKNLKAVVAAICDYNISIIVEGDTAFSLQLPRATSLAAQRAHIRAI